MWLTLSIATAFLESIKDVASKKSLGRIDEYTIAWSLNFFAFIVLLPIILLNPPAKIETSYVIALLISGSGNVITSILYMKALKTTDLSLSLPLLTFSSIFLLITSPIIGHEFPSPIGIVGVFLIFIGSYMLNITHRKNGFIAPLKALMSSQGARFMLFIAFIWAITSNFDKIGTNASSASFWGASLCLYASIALLILRRSKMLNFRSFVKNGKILGLIGLLHGIKLVTQMTAIQLTLVAYVISIKRSGIVLGVFWGWLIFKEKGLRTRLPAAALMVAGTILISLVG